MAHSPQPISIRAAYPDDDAALRRLAGLDSARVPGAPLVVAEVGGELLAALSLRDGRVIADPFHPTARLVVLLEVHAAALREPQWGGRPRRSALRAAAAVWRGLTARRPAPEPWRRPDPPPERPLTLAPHGLLRAP